LLQDGKNGVYDEWGCFCNDRRDLRTAVIGIQNVDGKGWYYEVRFVEKVHNLKGCTYYITAKENDEYKTWN